MIDAFVLITILFLTSYICLILIFIKGWYQVPYFKGNENVIPDFKVSLVICCKDEAHHLPVLIDALRNQSFQHFELVWVNDHSEDDTLQVIEQSRTYFPGMQIINSPSKGKKLAQQAGILAASGELIVTTDADCIPAEKWLESIVDFQTQYHADLIIAPVKLVPGTTLFTRIQQLEFATLVGSGMAAAGTDMPILCNAANMAFLKKAWLESRFYLHDEELSGDDVFLLLSIKKRKGKIGVLKSRDAMVMTGYKKTLKAFINQRRRWASKSSKYTDWHMISTGIIVAGVNFLLFALFLIVLCIPQLWLVFLSVFIIKLMIDFFFLQFIQPCFQFKLKIVRVLVLSLVYPIYVTFVGLSSLLWKKKDW